MQSSTPIIDLHIHSTIKPFGNSFYPNCNPKISNDLSCIWCPDKFNLTDNVIENITGIPRYRQSDFSTLIDGHVKIACVSLYPLERNFININQSFLKPIENQIAQFASVLGKKRIEYIKNKEYNYFTDLCLEYSYLKILDCKAAEGGQKKYKLLSRKEDISSHYNLLIIPTIEGCHSFCDGSDTLSPENWQHLERNVLMVQQWETSPIFVTFAHHFYNGLCTHAKSLFGISAKLLNQLYGMRDYDFVATDNVPPITETGKKLIRLLLDSNNGKRILIDIKHMSKEARNSYYDILENEFKDQQIPIIWSHGALNISTLHEINMDLIDVEKIYKSQGIIGIELDERILGYNKNLFQKFKFLFKNDSSKIQHESYYVWKQIITIAEFAYKNRLSDNPWECIALGSDYDGIINPLNKFKDASKLTELYQNLIIHLQKYWKNKNTIIPKNYRNMDATDVIYEIMYKNALNFIEKNYLI